MKPTKQKLYPILIAMLIIFSTTIVSSISPNPTSLYAESNIAEGTLIETYIPAPSMAHSFLKIPDTQPVSIYLPPSHDITEKRYPVVYFLPGYGTPNIYLTQWGVFQGYTLKESMDRLINEGIIPEMIVVIPNGMNYMYGGFYVNSSVAGKWRNFIVKDVVSYVDKNFQTIPEARSRAIGGHSMGGFGAINLAMRNPDVFSASYGLTPGIFDENGLADSEMFSTENINAYLDFEAKLAGMNKHEAKVAYLAYMAHLCIAGAESPLSFHFAYSSTFSPNAKKHPPYINYPYTRSGDELILNKKFMKNYERGYGNWDKKVQKYKKNLHQLQALIIDYGTQDYYQWIPRGCEYFSDLLTQENINHTLLHYEGSHSDRFKERLETVMFPEFANVLYFE